MSRELYIDNLYSSFNRHYKEQPTDNNVENLISSFETQEDVIALQAEVQANYEKAIASDENLSNMVTVTVADAYNAWATAIAQAQAQAQDAEEFPVRGVHGVLLSWGKNQIRAFPACMRGTRAVMRQSSS